MYLKELLLAYSYQFLVAFSALLIQVTSGIYYAWPAPSLPQLLNGTYPIQLTSDEGSWLSVTQVFGSPLGCILGTIGIDKIGRKKTILACAVPFFISWIMIVYANSVAMLFAARILAGIPDGTAFTAIPPYIGEISDPKIRGFLGSGISIMWTVGMLIVNLVGAYCDIPTTAWIVSVVPVILLLTFSWMPESPYFYLLKGKSEEARRVLEQFKGTKDVDDEFNRLKEAVDMQMKNPGKITDLFTQKENRRALWILIILRTTQQVSGTAAISFYTQIIFKEGDTSISPENATIIYVGVQLLTVILSSVVVDKAGRRPLMCISLLGCAISLFCLSTYFYLKFNTSVDLSDVNFIPIVALLAFAIFFNFGMQPIPLFMQGEIFPTNVKATASGFAEIYFWTVTAIVSKFFQIANDAFGMYLPLLVFAIACIISLIFVILFVPETKGKTLEQIQEEFDLKNKKKVDDVAL